MIRELREEGRVIIYVSHRMEEIFALSDAITVFKDGRYVRTFDDMRLVDHDALVQAMVGRNLGDIYGWKAREYGSERLRPDQIKSAVSECQSVYRYAAVKLSACLVWSAPGAAN